MFVNFFQILGSFFTLNFIQVIVDIYLVLFGAVIIVLNSKIIGVPFLSAATMDSLRAKIIFYCKLLDRTWGLGIFYFFVGTLNFSLLNVMRLLVSLYMLILGGVCFFNGRKTAGKLSDLRANIYAEKDLLRSFNKYANDGKINRDDFRTMLKSFDIEMAKSELETAFNLIDTDKSDTISFFEFNAWWKEWGHENLLEAQLKV